MSLPELLASPPSVSGNPWSLGTLSASMPNTSSAGAVEQYAVSTTAPASLRAANGRFTVAVGGEEMHVFCKPDGTTPWYFVRGVNGVIQAHASGDAIYHIPSAKSLRSFRRPSEMRSRRSRWVQQDAVNPGPVDNPAITLSAANAASAITGAAAVPSTPAGFTKTPGDPKIIVGGWPGPSLTQSDPNPANWPENIKWHALGGVTKTLGNYMAYSLNFDFYGTKLEIAYFAQGQGYNVFVNGVKQTVSAMPNDGTQRNLLLDWTAVGATNPSSTPALRRIRLECGAASDMMGFYHLATEDMLTPSRDLGNMRMIVTGDSWTDGTGTEGISTFGWLAGQMLGIHDTWNGGIGGTGYLADASGQGSHLGPRIANDIIAQNPDIVLLCFGSDDTAFTATQVANEAVADWKQIMGALPDTLLVVMGPYACPAAGGSPNYSNAAPYNTALAAAAADLGVHFINPIAESWITGTGYTGATNSTGTSDTLIGTDGVHPTQKGHDFMARRTAQKINAILQTL